MDYRCPLCETNLAKRRLSQAVMTRMEIECSNCKRRIRLNVHPAEEIAVLAGFGTCIALAAVAFAYQSQALGVAAFATAMLAALALPLLEKTYLRAWPRYTSREQEPG